MDGAIWDEGAPPVSSDDPDDMGSAPPDWNEYADVDPDDESDDEPANYSPRSKKILEVSVDRHKTSPPTVRAENTELNVMQRWKQIVTKLGEPLATIMSNARVDLISRNCAEITLPQAFRGLVTDAHVRDVDSILAKSICGSCQLSIRYDEIADETQTLAAQEAKARLEAQQKAFDRVLEHPMMKTIVELFHVNPDDIRFTINPDRTSQ